MVEQMKNWKTTLAGGIAAAVTAAATHFSATGYVVNWQGYAVAAGLAAIGYFAKDAGITGPAK